MIYSSHQVPASVAEDGQLLLLLCHQLLLLLNLEDHEGELLIGDLVKLGVNVCLDGFEGLVGTLRDRVVRAEGLEEHREGSADPRRGCSRIPLLHVCQRHLRVDIRSLWMIETQHCLVNIHSLHEVCVHIIATSILFSVISELRIPWLDETSKAQENLSCLHSEILALHRINTEILTISINV